MEAITNATEDNLIEGLSFKLQPGASYVTERKSATFWAVGSNVYNPTGGVKLVKFVLSADDWLDPSSVVFQFELVNKELTGSTGILRPVGQPHLFFRRLRVISGTLIEDLQDFGRNSELLASLQNEAVRDNNDIQGFGSRWDSTNIESYADWITVDTTIPGSSPPTEILTTERLLTGQRNYLPQINPTKSKIVNFKPLCGLFNQSKYIPLKFAPITLEFELGDINDAIVSPFAYGGFYQNVYTVANTTNNWEIQNCCIKCDICTLDNALNNSYVEHLLSGKALPISYSTYISQQSAISGTNFAVQVVRAVSRLQRAFITFYNEPTTTQQEPFRKSSITFHHPMYDRQAITTYNPDREISLFLQLGAKRYPEYECQSVSECFYRLKEAMNLPMYHQHSISIKFRNYINNKFIFTVSFEKVADAEYTGQSTKAGQILVVNGKAINSTQITDIAKVMYTLLESQQIMEIRDVGITIYD